MGRKHPNPGPPDKKHRPKPPPRPPILKEINPEVDKMLDGVIDSAFKKMHEEKHDSHCERIAESLSFIENDAFITSKAEYNKLTGSIEYTAVMKGKVRGINVNITLSDQQGKP